MYGGFDVFKVYLAVKLHFTSNYNYFDYDGKVNCKLETFTKRNDRYFFHKLSKKYGKDEILDFFVSNFFGRVEKLLVDMLCTASLIRKSSFCRKDNCCISYTCFRWKS